MEIVIIIGLAVWLILALRSIKKNGAGCCGDCAKCAEKCKDRKSE